MKKSILFLSLSVSVLIFGCSVKHSEPKEEKSFEESLAEDLLSEFQNDLGSWNACIVYNGEEYTSLVDFRNREK